MAVKTKDRKKSERSRPEWPPGRTGETAGDGRPPGESGAEATRLLEEHRAELDVLAQALIQRETLDETETLGVTGLTPFKDAAARTDGHNGPSPNGGVFARAPRERGGER